MPDSPCISNFGYLDSPNFLILTLHIQTAISTPIYFLGFYCILFKTPEAMKSVKWYLLVLHFWIVLFDYTICILTVPYILIPEFAGIPLGILSYMGVPASLQTVGTFAVFFFMLTSIVAIYENRFFILCEFRWKPTWGYCRRVWLFLHHVLMVLVLIPVFQLIPEQEKARAEVFRNLPCLPSYIYQEEVLVMAVDVTYDIVALSSTLIMCCFEAGFFIYQMIHNVREQQRSKRMSRKTFKMHKQLFMALVIQSTIPLFTLILTMFYAIITSVLSYYNQALINFCFVICTTHGFVSTVVMILVHKPYRLAVLGMIRREEKSPVPSVIYVL